jgi:phosphatidate cytidylyltransferase
MKRIATALVLIPLILFVVFAGPAWYWAFVLVVAAVGVIALYEFDNIAAAQGIPKGGIPAMIAGLVLMLAPEPFVVVLLIALVAMSISLRHDLKTALAGSASFLLGVIYIFGAWRCAVELRALSPHWLMIALLVSWVGDTAAYYVGRSIGKRKLAPIVSPGKTWEGAIGSAIGGALAAVVYGHFFLSTEPVFVIAAIGLAANIAGQFGDLCESAFKRGANIKDSGTTLPGHGGWLDRIDSSLFSIPTVYAILHFSGGF